MEIKGQIVTILDEVVISDKFKKHEFVIKTEDQYPQEILLQCVNAKTELLNNYIGGETVTAHINLRGRSFTRKDGTTGWANNIEC